MIKRLATSCLLLTLSVGLAAQPGPGGAAAPRVADVSWPEPGAIPVADVEFPFNDAQQALLPVLVPESFLRYRSLNYVGTQLDYTASVTGAGIAASIAGTRIAFDRTAAEGADLADNAVQLDFEDKIVRASFARFGVAYLISVECAQVADARCGGGAFVTRLAESLVLVAGRAGEAVVKPEFRQLIMANGPIPVSGPADFTSELPGALIPGSGVGVRSTHVYASSIRFPIESAPAYLNSQVWGIGGMKGAPGSWRDRRNYRYPWRDNFCESRSRKTAACPAGVGHQGVDIRPAGPEDRKYWAVAAEDGRIASIGSYSVVLSGASGTRYNYLHMERTRLAVRVGDRVTAGQRLGLVSDDFGGTSTPVHLHFEMMQNVNGKGLRHVPPYASLLKAYQEL